ncbi:hypothetical protein SUGI_0129640 [Cryptomeria japonica]|uniref:non-specific lipid-transfer protein 1 n=1 Tax=Cryptomeria japonica TaxID=3369 RepID=UPI002408A20C|nr:non-specific lipid-transfer protein 1 [Cryptomeria japonica]GLJ10517.1 hypothetical protein SUGI_0129640 [Cryptomeria japonica]
MAGVQKVFVVGAFAMLLMTTLMPMAMAANAMTCNTAVQNLVPCLTFLQSNGMGTPSAKCCSGVNTLAQMAKTSAAKRQICNCLKPQLNSSVKATDAAVTNLPIKCKVPLGFKISKSTNCNTL